MELETTGIQVLAATRPDILALIINDNFLPPTQVILSIQALEDNVQDKDILRGLLSKMLESEIRAIREVALEALGEFENELA